MEVEEVFQCVVGSLLFLTHVLLMIIWRLPLSLRFRLWEVEAGFFGGSLQTSFSFQLRRSDSVLPSSARADEWLSELMLLEVGISLVWTIYSSWWVNLVKIGGAPLTLFSDRGVNFSSLFWFCQEVYTVQRLFLGESVCLLACFLRSLSLWRYIASVSGLRERLFAFSCRSNHRCQLLRLCFVWLCS